MKKKTKVAIGVGAGVVMAAAAAATGAYMLRGSRGVKTRKAVRGWVAKARTEAAQAVKRLKKIDRASYMAAIDAALKRSKVLKDVDAREVAAIARELKGHWTKIKGQIERGMKAAKKKPARRPARRARPRRK